MLPTPLLRAETRYQTYPMPGWRYIGRTADATGAARAGSATDGLASRRTRSEDASLEKTQQLPVTVARRLGAGPRALSNLGEVLFCRYLDSYPRQDSNLRPTA